MNSIFINTSFFFSLFIHSFLYNALHAQSTYSLDLNFGAATNFPLPLRIIQTGYPDITLNAKYSSQSFKAPVYWDWRISRWNDKSMWEIESIHHKLYLSNKPEEVQLFNISHGFNFIFVNRGFMYKILYLKAGVGVGLAHPENRVRNQAYNEYIGLFELGYHFTGPAIDMAVGENFNLSKRIFIRTEIKTTYAYVQVPISNGHANVNNWAFHFAAGLGYNFIKCD